VFYQTVAFITNYTSVVVQDVISIKDLVYKRD
jgi:hypothetical protein